MVICLIILEDKLEAEIVSKFQNTPDRTMSVEMNNNSLGHDDFRLYQTCIGSN